MYKPKKTGKGGYDYCERVLKKYLSYVDFSIFCYVITKFPESSLELSKIGSTYPMSKIQRAIV